MKQMILAIIFSAALGCSGDDTVRFECHEGVIIGKIRSSGGGIAISVLDSSLGDHEWNGHKNVVEALNVELSYWQPDLHVFFLARPATEDEKIFPVSADGDESNKPIIYVIDISSDSCPTSRD